MSAQMILTLRNDLSELERVGLAVQQFGEDHRLPDKLVFEVGLALDEVLTNVISCAYDDPSEHEIRVRLTLERGELELEVEDDGRPFNPLEIPGADLSQPLQSRPIGGLGMHLVRSVMQQLEYRREAGANRLIMKRSAVVSMADRRTKEPGVEMELTRAKQNGVVMLALTGRLGGTSATGFEHEVLGLITGGERRLVIDLSALEYIGSAGVRVLLLAAKRLSAAGGKFAIVAPNTPVKEVLEITGLSSILQICSSREEAMAAV